MNKLLLIIFYGILICISSVYADIPGSQKLRITDLDVTIDGQSDTNLDNNSMIDLTARPDSDVSLKLEIENQYSIEEDIAIDDIRARITVIGFDGGSILQASTTQFDLQADDSKTLNFNFNIPSWVNTGIYSIFIEVTGEDENGIIHNEFWNVSLVVEDYQITVDKVKFDDYTIREGPWFLEVTRAAHLIQVQITANHGIQDVQLSAILLGSTYLIEDSTDTFNMNYNTTYTKQLTLFFPLNISSGTYTLKIIGENRYGILFEKNFSLIIVKQCDDILDNDIDGLIDREDPSCWDSNGKYYRELDDESAICIEGIDNDNDTFFMNGSYCGPLDCDDTNVSIRPIRNAEIINESIKICKNSYRLPNGITIGANNIILDCDGARISSGYLRDIETNGIFLKEIKNVHIKNCFIIGYNFGINLYKSSNNTIAENKLTDSEDAALILRFASNNSIINNQVLEDCALGFTVGLSNNNYFANNVLKGSIFGFIVEEDSNNNILLNNTITNNDIGLVLDDDVQNIVENNYIHNNSDYNVWNAQSLNVSLEKNYWATTNITEIKSKIYDYYVDESFGIIDFCPILNAPWPYGNSISCEMTSYTLHIQAGWNLISIPLDIGLVTPQKINELFQGIDSIFVYIHNETYEGWTLYDVYRPDYVNNLNMFNPNDGFWIKTTENINVTISAPEFQTFRRSVYSGWNLIGYPSLISRNLHDVFGNEPNVLRVVMYNTSDEKWYSYGTTLPSFLNTLNVINPGYGYWIYVNQETNLAFQ